MATEKRLIYLEDAKEALIGWETDPTDEEIEWTLDQLSKVDAVEVKHGRWVMPKESYGLVCSVCGGSCWYYDYDQTIGDSNYCPNCGADMRERKDNGTSKSAE
jgi:hypothetical protein